LGRRSIPSQNSLSEKYAQLVARFKENIHRLFEQVFAIEKQALISLQNGENTLEDTIRAFQDEIAVTYNQIGIWAADLKSELEVYALNVEGEWINIINQYSQNVDLSVKTMRIMFERLIQELMKNLVGIALKVIPEAAATIQNLQQQGLLSFLSH